MRANIIHGGLPQRMKNLLWELEEQNIYDYEIWEGLHDRTSVIKSINLSHKQIVQYAKDCGLPEVLIMEDDVKFCGEGAFRYFLKNKPVDFDIYLSGIYRGTIKEDKTVNDWSGFHCYIVHERFYDKYLSVPDDLHIDVAMKGLGKFVVCDPFACIQYNGFSQNTKKEEIYDNLLQGRSLYKKDLDN